MAEDSNGLRGFWTNKEDSESVTLSSGAAATSASGSPVKSSDGARPGDSRPGDSRSRKIGAALVSPDVTPAGVASPASAAVSASSSGSSSAGSGSGGAPSTSGGSDFFRPRAGSDSRAGVGVLGKMASMTRTRWRSGEGPALQPQASSQGHSSVAPGSSQTVHGVASSGSKNRSVFDIFPKNFRPRSKSDAAGKSKRPKAGSAEGGGRGGAAAGGRPTADHTRSPPATPAGGGTHQGGALLSTSSPYTTYHGGMFSGPQRGQKTPHLRDLFADPRALLAQDRRSRLSLHGQISERFEIEHVADNQVFVKFMKTHRCHDLIPDGYNNKLIVFDTQLKVQKAFFALMEHGVRAAPLWDSSRQDFVGMLTISDFITILQKYYRSPLSSKQDIKSHVIATWRDVLKNHNERIGRNQLIFIGPDATLYDGIKKLHSTKVHRLAVMDAWSGNVIQILTHKRLLRFLFQFNHELPRPTFVFKSIWELGVGTYTNIITVSPEMPLINALNKFCKHQVSALPVVDKDNILLDIYAKFDTIKLASNQTYNNLDITIRQALQFGNVEGAGGPFTCRKEESLQKVMERIVRCNVHRLVIVDDENRVEGVVSLSDIVYHIVLHQETASDEDGAPKDQTDVAKEAGDDAVFAAPAGAAPARAEKPQPHDAPPPNNSATDHTTTVAEPLHNGTSSSHTQPKSPSKKSPSPTGKPPGLKLFVPPPPIQNCETSKPPGGPPLTSPSDSTNSAQTIRNDCRGDNSPSPLRESYQKRNSPSDDGMKSGKGKKLTPIRKKSIVEDVIPEYVSALDLNVPELV